MWRQLTPDEFTPDVIFSVDFESCQNALPSKPAEAPLLHVVPRIADAMFADHNETA